MMADDTMDAVPVDELCPNDRALYNRMDAVRHGMHTIAERLRWYKGDSQQWMAHAAEIEGAATILAGWMRVLRIEAAKQGAKK